MEIDMENMQWPEEDAALKQFPKGNPFTVPAGYFDDLSQRLQSYVHLDDRIQAAGGLGFAVPENYFEDLSSHIQSRIAVEEVLSKDAQGFAVPEGYFDELSNNIQSRIAIEEMVNAEDTGFTVPEGYFDELSSNLMSRMAIDNLAGQPDDAGYAVPEGYFNQLHEQITSRINLEETVSAEATGFAVPEGYFSELSNKILSQTSEKQEAKVVVMQPARRSIIRKLVSSAALKYASAACFALIVGVAIYLKQGSDPEARHEGTYLHKELSEISTGAIETYLEQQTDASDSEHTVVTEGTKLDVNSLKNALQDDLNEE